MELKICDHCKQETDSLFPLRSEYKTKEVKEICHPCLKKLNDFLFETRSEFEKLLSKEVRGNFNKYPACKNLVKQFQLRRNEIIGYQVTVGILIMALVIGIFI